MHTEQFANIKIHHLTTELVQTGIVAIETINKHFNRHRQCLGEWQLQNVI